MSKPNEQQVLYQRNMLLGILTATLCAAITAVVLLLASPPTVGSPDGASSEVIEIRLGKTPQSRVGKALSGMLTKKGPGFLGFEAQIRIIPDQPASIVTSPKVAVPPLPPSLTATDPDLKMEPAPLSTGIDQFSLPAGDYLPEADTLKSARLLNHDVVVMQRIDPEYPLVARQARKEGQVTLRICVGANGQLKPLEVETVKRHKRVVQQVMYVVVHEQPGGYFFAENLVKVLPYWAFVPKIENGSPVEAQLDVTYRFVLSPVGASITGSGKRVRP
jgi:hypothetical protein